MATNYERGRKKEYRICEKLREEGFDIVQRTAGSHSPIDIIAIRKADKKIRLVQSKPKSLSDSAKRKLLEENCWLDNGFDVEFVVM